MKIILTTTLCILIVSTSHAMPYSYECRVKTVQEVSKDGNIIKNTENLKKQIGSTFSVNKKTGEIRGGYYINNKYTKNVEVINLNKNSEYYAVSKSHGPPVSVSYLFVNKRENSIENEFTYVSSGNWIYTGTCK